MEIPAILKNKWVLGGGAALIVVGLFLYMRGGAARSAPPAENENALMGVPSMLYSPPGVSGAAVGGIGGALPSMDSIMGAGNGAAGAPANFADFLKSMVAADTKAADLKTLTTLGLNAGMTGAISHTADGTQLTVTQKPRDPSTYTSSEIRDFINDQAGRGVPINAATIGLWQTQYKVPDAQLGAAYGFDVAGVNAWKAANPAIAVNSPSPAPAPAPTVTVAQRPEYSDQQIRDFVAAKQSGGAAVNASNIRQWAHENNVAVARVGQAFGMDSAGTAQWLASNPG